MLVARRSQLLSGHAERRGRVVDVELRALEQLLGNQCCARVAARIDVVERAGQEASRDVGRLGAHHHDEDELRVPRWAIGQVVGKQEALARARGDDAPAISDRLHIHRLVIGANPTMLAPPIPRGFADGDESRAPASVSAPALTVPSRRHHETPRLFLTRRTDARRPTRELATRATHLPPAPPTPL